MQRVCSLAGRLAVRLRRPPADREAGFERAAIRVLVPSCLFVALVASAWVLGHLGEAPAIALRSHLILAVELVVVFFYGLLLVLLPLVRAIARGELPTELSPRGARYEATEATSESVNRRLDEHERLFTLYSNTFGELRHLAERVGKLENRE